MFMANWPLYLFPGGILSLLFPGHLPEPVSGIFKISGRVFFPVQNIPLFTAFRQTTLYFYGVSIRIQTGTVHGTPHSHCQRHKILHLLRLPIPLFQKTIHRLHVPPCASREITDEIGNHKLFFPAGTVHPVENRLKSFKFPGLPFPHQTQHFPVQMFRRSRMIFSVCFSCFNARSNRTPELMNTCFTPGIFFTRSSNSIRGFSDT